MRSERKSTVILCIYIIIMLAVCALAVKALKMAKTEPDNDSNTTGDTTPPVTQIIYIPVFSETDSDTMSETEFETESPAIEYTVKSYEGKIGIFSENGTLLQVIDVYIKTLPKADRSLLEKGILVRDEAELRSIIEDYTG